MQGTLFYLPTSFAAHYKASTVDDEFAVVATLGREKDIINCSAIDFANTRRHIFGDTTNDDNDNNNEGVNQGVPNLLMGASNICSAVPLLPVPDAILVRAAT